jgi:hypothetical protein
LNVSKLYLWESLASLRSGQNNDRTSGAREMGTKSYGRKKGREKMK